MIIVYQNDGNFDPHLLDKEKIEHAVSERAWHVGIAQRTFNLNDLKSPNKLKELKTL